MTRAVVTALVAWLAAPALAEAPVVRVGSLPWAGMGGEALAARACLDQFRVEHPGVKVEHFEYVAMPYRLYSSAWIMSLTAGAGPDVIHVDLKNLSTLAREGILQPVDDLFEAYPWKDRLWSGYNDALRLDGHVWGLSDSPSLPVLAARPKLWAAAGLNPAALPATWTDLARAAATLTTHDRPGLLLPRGESLIGLWIALARQAGGDPGTLGPDGRLHVDFGSSPAVEAAGALRALGDLTRSAGGRVEFVDDLGAALKAFASDRAPLALLSTDQLVASTDRGPLWSTGPLLFGVPGAKGPGPLAWAGGDNTIRALPAYLGGRRRALVWDYLVEVFEENPLYDETLLKALDGRTVFVSPDTLVRHPTDQAFRGLPPSWAPLLRSLLEAARPLPPSTDVATLVDALSPGLERLMTVGGDPVAVLAAARQVYEEMAFHSSRRTPGWTAAGWILLLLVAGTLAASVTSLIRSLRREWLALRAAPAGRLSGETAPVLLGLFVPGMVLSAMFGAYPLLLGFKMSLFQHVLSDRPEWTGARNYLELLLDPAVHEAAWNTLRFLGWSLVFGFAAPFLLALAVASLRRLQPLVRSLLFAPAVANAVVLALVWEQLLAPGGLANLMGEALGVPARDWLGDPGWAMAAAALAQAWGTLGISVLVYLAALAAIPTALFEEAEVAGAGLADRFVHVILPQVAPVLAISFIGWLLTAARVTEHILLLTSGGPGRSTWVLGLDIFSQAYWRVRFGYALAEVWVLVALILSLMLLQVRAARERQVAAAL